MLLLYSHFFKKSLQFANFLRSFFTDLFYFICLKFNPQYWYLLRREKIIDLVVIFKEQSFAVSLQNRKSRVRIKYLTLVRAQKLIAMNFTFLYSICNAQNSSIAKNYSFHIFFNRFVCLFLFKKTFLPQKMFMSVYVTPWRLLERYI